MVSSTSESSNGAPQGAASDGAISHPERPQTARQPGGTAKVVAQWFGDAPALTVLGLIAVVALVLRSRFPDRVACTLGAINLWYAFVVGWNFAVLARS